MRRRDLPTPEQILEELADRAAVQIDRLAPIAFEAALKELIRYHRFLLALNASRSPEGSPVSLAEVSGSSWLAPHQEWVRQYRRLFERAADRLSDDPEFATRLAYVPRELLPRDGEFDLSDAVLRSLVGLVPILAHRLEAWVTGRSNVESTEDALGTGKQLALTESDSEVYASVVSDIVGTWESFLHDGSSVFGNKVNRDSTDNECWNALRASWSFLWQHLQDSAYLLAIAVWKEDKIGADLYRDALIRWPVTYDSDLLDSPDGLNIRLLLPDIFSLEWEQASALIRPTLPVYQPVPKPRELFHAMLRYAHSDVVLLTSALFLSWKINNKQLSRIGAETASALLRRALNEPDDLIGARTFNSSFRSRFLELVRLAVAGAQRRKDNYDSRLDRLVEVLDAMTERRVVTGRVYSPSTFHDRSGLLLSLLVILLAEVPEEGDDGVLTVIQQLAAKEHAFPEGDRAFRQLCHELEMYSNALGKSTAGFAAALESLIPNARSDVASAKLQTLLQRSLTTIKSVRTNRLQQKPVDKGKLERLRAILETAILKSPAAIPFFRKFTIETRAGRLNVKPIDFTLMKNFPKAQLVEPPMENEISNLEGSFIKALCQFTAKLVWDSFRERHREVVRIGSTITDEAFWRDVRPLAARLHQCPVLVISANTEGRALRELMYGPGRAATPFRIKQIKPNGVVGNYIATVEGIEVYAGNFEPGIAWLFSGQALEAIRYYATNEAGDHVALTFEALCNVEGNMVASVMQVVDWTVDPVLELELGNLGRG